MDQATEKPTPRQRHRLRQLLLSSVFTAEEGAPRKRMARQSSGDKRSRKRSDHRCFVADRSPQQCEKGQ